MIDQKRENLLNLALAATEVERRRVPELSAGYNSYSKTWEVIVQYQGDLAFLEEQGVRVTLLLFSYAILLVPESLMDYVTGLPQITYLEKPKPLFFADAFMRSISCITPVQEGISGLYGNGVLLACIDSGVDYAHPDFCARMVTIKCYKATYLGRIGRVLFIFWGAVITCLCTSGRNEPFGMAGVHLFGSICM